LLKIFTFAAPFKIRSMTKKIIQIALSLIIVFLAFMVYRSIMEPVRYKTEREARERKVVERLKDIRSAQSVFKSVNGRYTADFDSLINFLQSGTLPVVLKIGNTPDTLTETEALKLGIIRRDTSYVSVMDSLFSNIEYNLSDLPFIPFSKGERFELEAGHVDKGGYQVPVVECRAHYNTFLKGMDKQATLNHIDRIEKLEKYTGLKFGNMFDASLDGNWE
jgi:hypothetical protein